MDKIVEFRIYSTIPEPRSRIRPTSNILGLTYAAAATVLGEGGLPANAVACSLSSSMWSRCSKQIITLYSFVQCCSPCYFTPWNKVYPLN